MLPFLKKEHEGSMAEDVLPEEEEYGAVDAVADDIMSALEAKDKGLLKAALQSLVDLIKSEDVEQDEELLINE